MAKIKFATFVISCCLVAGIVPTATGQLVIGSTGVNRTNYERGIRYKGEPFGWIANGCAADDFSGVIVYGDSANQVPMKHNAQPVPSGPQVPVGRYVVSNDDHIYWQVGNFTIHTEARIHCYGSGGGTGTYPTDTAITVYERIPVYSLETVVISTPTRAANVIPSAARSSKPRTVGDSVNFILTLTAPAPPSDTRVRIIIDRPDLFVDPPAEVIVPAGRTQQNFFLEFRGEMPPGSEAYVAAVTVGDPTHMLKIKYRGQ